MKVNITDYRNIKQFNFVDMDVSEEYTPSNFREEAWIS
jgi:hypothetical protein